MPPPVHLRHRATANADPAAFRAAGQALAAVFSDAITGQLGSGPVTVLDWGCGCGRVAAPLQELQPSWGISGCDVDAEAAAWCDAHLAGRFITSWLRPPLPYQDQQFDTVIACSVFTHLTAEGQHEWLDELRRVLRPRGILVASVHGEPAYRKYIPVLPTMLADNGIFDELITHIMDGVIPAGRYRDTFQSEAWTRENWGQHLDVVSYTEAGLTPEHDLVVCRR